MAYRIKPVVIIFWGTCVRDEINVNLNKTKTVFLFRRIS